MRTPFYRGLECAGQKWYFFGEGKPGSDRSGHLYSVNLVICLSGLFCIEQWIIDCDSWTVTSMTREEGSLDSVIFNCGLVVYIDLSILTE